MFFAEEKFFQLAPLKTWQLGFVSMTVFEFASMAGTFVARCTLLKGVIEYSRQGAQRRAEHLIRLRREFSQREEFKRIATA